jgi:Cft2 family RNA processing exonuclease
VKLSFHGAARSVTGSCHPVEANGQRELIEMPASHRAFTL